MKKILAVLALAVSGSVFAASVTVEGQAIDNQTGNDQRLYSLSAKQNITKNLVGDVLFANAYSKETNGVAATRIEAGLTPSMALGPVTGYTRVSVGQRAGTSNKWNYYAVEPGIRAPLGNGFTASVGYRYRAAFDDSIADTTRTLRTGVSYNLTKSDTIGVRFDRVKGDSDQKVWAVNYTRSF